MMYKLNKKVSDASAVIKDRPDKVRDKNIERQNGGGANTFSPLPQPAFHKGEGGTAYGCQKTRRKYSSLSPIFKFSPISASLHAMSYIINIKLYINNITLDSFTQ